MKKLLLVVVFALPFIGFSQWKTAALGTSEIQEGKERIEYAGMYALDAAQLKMQLNQVADRFSHMPGKVISMPNTLGQMEQFEVWEAPALSPELQAKFPEIRSYVGKGITDPTAYLRFSLSPEAGLSTMVFRSQGTEFIEPYTRDLNRYIVFNSKSHRDKGQMPFECSTPEADAIMNTTDGMVDAGKSSAGVFKTFRLALAGTGEYTQAVGGTVAAGLAAMNTTMTRINGVYERDFAVNLILIPNNDELVFTNASTDPFTNPNSNSPTQTQLQNYLDANIGADNYDIGHLFHRHTGGSGSGNAGCIGCVCVNGQKGRGWTSLYVVTGDAFDIDFAAHEFGHQVGGNHTFSWNWEGTGVNVEPGSGSTIMGYAGVTTYNVQMNSDDYFTYMTQFQVQNNLQNKPCAENIDITGNTAPEVDAGPDYEIPHSTAFRLEGSGTDADGDVLDYTWEQRDTGTSATTGANSRVSFTKVIGPNFRSYYGDTEPVRWMPSLEWVLDRTGPVYEVENYWRSKWEAVTTVPRTFNFSLTARDNNPAGPQSNTDLMRVYVRDAGPFEVTTPERNDVIDLGDGNMLVEWGVNGTDSAPINTSEVRILISTDGGNTFNVAKASTPNDGSEVINFPTGTTATNEARIMIEPIGNIYYAVSQKFKLEGVLGLVDFDTFSVGIYPNPNDGQFYVKAGDVAKGAVKTTIIDTAGRTVYNEMLNHNGGSLQHAYNVNLPSGVYIIVIETEKGVTNQKLIIK